MSKFVVVIFSDETKARQGARVVEDLHAGDRSALHGLAIVAKDPDGKLSLKQSIYEGPHGTAVGALIGALAGVAGGPVAATFGAAAGALLGLSADLVNRGASTAFLEKAARALLPAKAAVIAEISEDAIPVLDAQMRLIGGKIVHEE